MAQARVSIAGTSTDSTALWDWLRNEEELRGHLEAQSRSPQAGTMGAGTDFVVQTLASGSALWTALARSLSTFLTQRRSDVSITIEGPDGRSVTVTANRVADAEGLIQSVLATAPHTMVGFGVPVEPEDNAAPNEA